MIANNTVAAPKEVPVMDGKIYKQLPSGLNGAGTTYWKLGKYDEKSKYYNCVYIKTTDGNQMINACPYNMYASNLAQSLKSMVEVTPTEFYYLMRDAIDQYCNSIKKSLGITDQDPPV